MNQHKYVELRVDPWIVLVALAISVGDRVRWELETGYHNAAAYHPEHQRPMLMPTDAEPWEAPHMGTTGQAFEITFEKEGVYFYHCHPHEAEGMVGVIVVGKPQEMPGLDQYKDQVPPLAFERLTELLQWAKEAR